MSVWYYSEADRVVGPFQVEALGKLLRAGVITDGTLVRSTEQEDWQPLTAVLAADAARTAAMSGEARYYYLDTNDQPIGPFDLATMHCLHAERVLAADTLVSAIGESEWIPAARLLGLTGTPASAPTRVTTAATITASDGMHPRYLPFERYVLLTVFTLGLYPFYLVPCQSRDLKAITGRERMEFTALLILGIVTLSLVTLVVQVLYAFDLERHGKSVNRPGRRESLGTVVLVLTVLAVVLSFAIDSFFVGYLVGTLFGSASLWLVQKEINLYAAAPGTAAA